MANEEFVALLRKCADVLELRKVEWKPRAYRRAARGIENLKQPLKQIYDSEGKKGLEKIPGVGKSIALHIEEYLKTGKVKKWEGWFRSIPSGASELMNVQGLGPSKVKALQEKLKIKSVADLKKAIKSGKIRGLPDFGEKTEQNLLQSLETYKKGQERMLISRAMAIAEETIAYLEENAKPPKLDYAGSLRRMCETIGDIDILASSEKSSISSRATSSAARYKNPSKCMETFVKMPSVARVLAKGPTKSSVLLKSGVQVDLRILPADQYGAALLYFTGSKQHNIDLRKIAIRKGYKLSEYGLFSKRTNKSVASRTEAGIYRKLGLAYIPPEMRESRGEIEAASRGKVPSLIGHGDIRGDLHTHTDYSDGAETVEQMVKAAKARGYEYIAITDHSQSEKIAHGLNPERLKSQWKEIDRVAKKHRIKVLKGAEVSILNSGELDYPEEILKKLDLCVCGVHTSFRMPRAKMTERICIALQNKYLDILAHPSGRLIGKRPEYAVDFDKVFRCAADNGKVLEINSQPQRLDLKDSHIFLARNHRTKFSIGTDAHAGAQLDYVKYGIGQARRGWLTKSRVVNTLPYSELKKIFKRI